MIIISIENSKMNKGIEMVNHLNKEMQTLECLNRIFGHIRKTISKQEDAITMTTKTKCLERHQMH